jgi:hypothetical protein
MKKLLLAALIGLSLVAVSDRASADTLIQGATVTYIGTRIYDSGWGGVMFSIDEAHQSQVAPCAVFVIGKEDFNFNTAMAMLLTAYVSKSPVNIYTGPWGYHPDSQAYADRIKHYSDFCAVSQVWLAPTTK